MKRPFSARRIIEHASDQLGEGFLPLNVLRRRPRSQSVESHQEVIESDLCRQQLALANRGELSCQLSKVLLVPGLGTEDGLGPRHVEPDTQRRRTPVSHQPSFLLSRRIE